MSIKEEQYYYIIKNGVKKELKPDMEIFKDIISFVNIFSGEPYKYFEYHKENAIGDYKRNGYNDDDLKVIKIIEIRDKGGYFSIFSYLIVANEHSQDSIHNEYEEYWQSWMYTKKKNEYYLKIKKIIENFFAEDMNNKEKETEEKVTKKAISELKKELEKLKEEQKKLENKIKELEESKFKINKEVK
jgi:hypothetical protein